MSDFSDRPFVAGSVVGLRAFNVDGLGRLTGPSLGGIFTPGENVAECKKGDGLPFLTFAPSHYNVGGPVRHYNAVGNITWTVGDFNSAPSEAEEDEAEPEVKPEPKPHSIAGLNCSCGFYAYFDGRNDYKNSDNIAAVIEGYGVCTVGTRGFRASKARLLGLIVPGKHFSETRFRLIERNYPDVPMYARKRDALAAHPLSEGHVPSPDEPDFWTRSAR